MRAAQNVIEQGGFARAKKTGKQSDWNRIHWRKLRNTPKKTLP